MSFPSPRRRFRPSLESLETRLAPSADLANAMPTGEEAEAQSQYDGLATFRDAIVPEGDLQLAEAGQPVASYAGGHEPMSENSLPPVVHEAVQEPLPNIGLDEGLVDLTPYNEFFRQDAELMGPDATEGIDTPLEAVVPESPVSDAGDIVFAEQGWDVLEAVPLPELADRADTADGVFGEANGRIE